MMQNCGLYRGILIALLALHAIEAAVSWHPDQNEPETVLGSRWSRILHRRSVETDGDRKYQTANLEEEEGFFDANCSNINDPGGKYNSSCEAVREECGDSYELFNYLELVTCDLVYRVRSHEPQV